MRSIGSLSALLDYYGEQNIEVEIIQVQAESQRLPEGGAGGGA